MHQRPPRRRGSVVLAVITAVVLLLGGCSVVDQGLSAPAQPSAAPTTASAAATPTPTATPDGIATTPADGDAGTGDDDGVARDERRVGADDGSDSADGAADDGDAGQPDGSGNDDQAAADSNGSSGSGDDDAASDPADNVTRTLRRGDSGAQVRRLQRRLKDLHYWVGPVDGVYGQLTEQAVFAFQGVEGLSIDGVTGPNTRAALAEASPPTARSDSGNLIEVDEQARVVLDVRGGEVRWAWHTSTGTNQRYQHPAGHTALAETPDGRHTIDWQVDGWRENELGRLWRPKYFHPDGIALHGFSSVPASPSSHGCVRLTLPAMDFIWANDIAPEGSTVWVYGRAP